METLFELTEFVKEMSTEEIPSCDHPFFILAYWGTAKHGHWKFHFEDGFYNIKNAESFAKSLRDAGR